VRRIAPSRRLPHRTKWSASDFVEAGKYRPAVFDLLRRRLGDDRIVRLRRRIGRLLRRRIGRRGRVARSRRRRSQRSTGRWRQWLRLDAGGRTRRGILAAPGIAAAASTVCPDIATGGGFAAGTHRSATSAGGRGGESLKIVPNWASAGTTAKVATNTTRSAAIRPMNFVRATVGCVFATRPVNTLNTAKTGFRISAAGPAGKSRLLIARRPRLVIACRFGTTALRQCRSARRCAAGRARSGGQVGLLPRISSGSVLRRRHIDCVMQPAVPARAAPSRLPRRPCRSPSGARNRAPNRFCRPCSVIAIAEFVSPTYSP